MPVTISQPIPSFQNKRKKLFKHRTTLNIALRTHIFCVSINGALLSTPLFLKGRNNNDDNNKNPHRFGGCNKLSKI
jgi:hypothetical protein